MKNRNMVILSLIFLSMVLIPSLFLSPPSKGAALHLRVGAYEMPPKIFSDENGDWVGFWPDILQYIAGKEGWTIDWIEGTWTECTEDYLMNGTIDIMPDVAFDKDRNLLYDFNNITVFSNWAVVYARHFGIIYEFADLENKTIAVMKGSIHTIGDYGIMNMTKAFGINCTFLMVPDYKQVLEMVENGTAEAGVVNRLFGLEKGDEYDVVQTSLIFNPADLKFAFPKNATLNNYLIERIDYHLTVLQSDPDSIYYSSIEHYFMGIPIIETIPEWLIFLIITVTIVGLIFVSMSIYLKRVVNQKTTELRATNAELEILNRIFLDTMPSGVLFIYEDGELSLVNQAFNNFYSKAYAKTIETSTNVFNLPDNALTVPVKSQILEAKNNSHLTKTPLEKQSIFLEPSTYLELVSFKIQLKRMDRNLGYLFVFRDVTSFIELENLRQQFLSMVTHELRTPIAAIILSIHNLLKYRKKLDEEQLDKILVIMQRNGDLLSVMLEDLLTAARIEAASIDLEKRICNLSDIVQSIQQELGNQIKEKNITLKVEIDSNIQIQADLKRISQVFRILIDNAVKFSPIQSEIRIQAIENYQGPENPKGISGVLIKVIDQGIGIPKCDLPRLFQRFHRGSNVGNVNGSGLGLNIAKTLIELHDGKISVESQEGRGSTFAIFLPK